MLGALSRGVYTIASPFDVDAKPDRELTEAEFFAIGCGYSMSHLLSLVSQLEYAPAYLRESRISDGLRAAGVTRLSDVVYHWENYLIRSRGLEDRVLQLVCDVLHLGIDRKNVNFSLIRRNAHVRSISVAAVLDRLHKLIQSVANERNRIIHERGVLDEDFRRLEFWLVARRLLPDRKGIAIGQYLTGIREIAPSKAAEIEAFLKDAHDVLLDLFDDLAPRYAKKFEQLVS